MPKTKKGLPVGNVIASAAKKAAQRQKKSLGMFTSTAYGPPWDGPNGMQGSGTTSQGTKLPKSPGPQAGYLLIAGDPTVLKYGSWYHVQPNPFNTDRPFKMDDTGGAFQGGKRKVDFLVLEGRKAQLAWGTRQVKVTQATGPNDTNGEPSESESEETQKTTTVRLPYKFRVEPDEDYWTAIQRLADEVRFRAFMRDGQFWYVSDNYLASRPVAAEITPSSPYLISHPSFDLDNGKPADEVSLSVLAGRYDLPPGARVELGEFGPGDGTWIVSEVSRELTSDLVSVTLKRPEDTKREPAPETTTKTEGGSSSSGKVDDDGTPLSSKGGDGVYKAAMAISQQNLPYAWGGGHGSAGTPSKSQRSGESQTGYDCSGYVYACLVGGGYYPKGKATGNSVTLMSIGKPGKGKDFTIWSNAAHTFIEFHGSRKYRYADTSRQAGGPAGPHVRSGTRSTAGFVPRHL